MSTTIYPEVSKRMAMKIDGEYAFKWISRMKFLRMAEKLGISASLMGKEIDRMCHRITRQAPLVVARLSAKFPSLCYQRIVDGIDARVAQLTCTQA